MFKVGIENVWPTPLPFGSFELMTWNDVPHGAAVGSDEHWSDARAPMVPVTSPSCWLRSGLPESNWKIVTLIFVWAGTCQMVVCTHLPCAFIVRYETHVGWSPRPSDPTVWRS